MNEPLGVGLGPRGQHPVKLTVLREHPLAHFHRGNWLLSPGGDDRRIARKARGQLRVQRARVEKGRRGGAEAAGLVERVERGDPRLAIAGLAQEEAHGHAHPEELRGLDAARLLADLVHDQVPVVEGLDAKEVELEVGRGVEGRGQADEVVLQELGVEPLESRCRARGTS